MRAILVLCAGCALPAQKVNPLACANDPAPTTAPASVAITGSIADPYQGAPVAGATVALQPSGFTTTTSATGQFSGTVMTGGMPSASFLKVTGPGYVDTYFYPAAPLAADLDVTLQLLLTQELVAIGSASGLPLGSNSEQLVVSVVDCQDDAVGNATITSAGDVIYFANDKPDPTATSTDALTGAALVVGITGSDAALSANADGIMFRNHSVGTMPGTLTETEIRP